MLKDQSPLIIQIDDSWAVAVMVKNVNVNVMVGVMDRRSMCTMASPTISVLDEVAAHAR
jgi:hypothetical protein